VSTAYRCGTRRRRQAVRETPGLNGVDHLEVEADQLTLQVFFLAPLPGTPEDPTPPPPAPPLTVDNVEVEGGVRVQGIRVTDVATNGHVLTVVVDRPGDFSTYVVRLRRSREDPEPPEGFDRQLAEVSFSFKAGCSEDLDCAPVVETVPEPLDEPEVDYLAKDYASLRRLMLDRLSATMPDWRERNPADVQLALVELLAYVGDHLSYFQDAVATEAYLATARDRVSVRRHARLLDYAVHEGCNARAWVCLEVEEGGPADGLELPAGTPLLTRGSSDATTVDPAGLEPVLAVERPTVFETMEPVTLHGARNAIRLHTWSDTSCQLPAGSTTASLRDDPPLGLEPGDTLVLEEVLSPVTGRAPDADSSRRHPVRLTEVRGVLDRVDDTPVLEVRWDDEDALPFPLCVSAPVPAGGVEVQAEIAVARGNVVLADHGRTVGPEPLAPAHVPSHGAFRPGLAQAPLTFRAAPDPGASAAGRLRSDPRGALPELLLEGDGGDWWPRADLLGSDRFAPHVVVEMRSDRVARLRFGDDVHGRRPTAGATFTATYRLGNGTAGNVGAEALTRLVTSSGGITGVRNPLPARGGTEPEPLERVRVAARQAFRTQRRAVTEDDYAEVAGRHPGVQKAAATLRWTGSWHTVFVTVDRRGGGPVDEAFADELRDWLDLHRMAGHDLELRGPVMVPLDVALHVCVEPGYVRGDVAAALREVLGSGHRPAGRRGFFHPDAHTFGEPVFLSQLYEAALTVAGVAWIHATRFRRFGREADGELEAAVLTPGPTEVVRLDHDPNFPENGRLELDLVGGL
jgi:hypothetical protein